MGLSLLWWLESSSPTAQWAWVEVMCSVGTRGDWGCCMAAPSISYALEPAGKYNGTESD